MKVVIAGAGMVGQNIATYLARAGNDVTVIDQRPDLVQRLGETLDIRALTGFASHPSVLERAGCGEADLLIAVTYADEVNMVACEIAHTLFKVPTTIARIRQQDYLQSRWQDLFSRGGLPIDVIISPEMEIARAMARRLELPGALDAIPFADDKVRLIAVHCQPSTPILDTPLRQLTRLFPDLHLTVVAITRGERLFVPEPDDQILVDDEVHFVIETSQIQRGLTAFGYDEPASERIVIAGGGNIGLYLAGELEERLPKAELRLIEFDAARAEMVADTLERTVVLQGDATDREIQLEAGIADADAIVTVTNEDEVNVMAALLGKRLGCRRAMALINNATYASLIRSVGIDVAVNPRDTTVSSILQHVRRGRIKAVHTLRDGEAEIYEAEALETSPLVGKSLRDVRLPSGMIIGVIVRDEKVVLPRGDTVVRPKDRVVLVARADMVKKVEQLFAVRLDYF